MSIFSSSVKSQIIDPVFHSESRCEFRLANRGEAYMPTLRLGNIGLTKDAGNNNTYHFGPGAASVISRIRLMDGNEELDSLRNAAQWLTFKGLQKTNSENVNVMSNLEGGSIGWSAGATGELLSNENKTIREGESTTLGSIDLRDCFGFLNSVSHLSTKLFPNLRVVIEYHANSNPALMVNNVSQVAGLKKVVPILIADEITDDRLVATLDAQLKSASWVAVEVDTASVPQVPGITAAGAVTDSAVQRTSLRINGFQNKAVSRMMIAKTFQDPDAYLYGGGAADTAVKGLASYGSRALHKERFNMRVNGRNLLSGDGLTSPAQMSMMLSDVWGEIDMCPGQDTESVGVDSKYGLTVADPVTATIIGNAPKNWVGVNRTEPRVLTNSGALDAAGTAWATPPTAQQGYWVGNSSFIGLPVHDRVTDLQLDLVRTGTPSSAASAPGTYDAGTVSSAGNYLALNLSVFAEVSKRLDVMGGDYKISYA